MHQGCCYALLGDTGGGIYAIQLSFPPSYRFPHHVTLITAFIGARVEDIVILGWHRFVRRFRGLRVEAGGLTAKTNGDTLACSGSMFLQDGISFLFNERPENLRLWLRGIQCTPPFTDGSSVRGTYI